MNTLNLDGKLTKGNRDKLIAMITGFFEENARYVGVLTAERKTKDLAEDIAPAVSCLVMNSHLTMDMTKY